MVCILLCYELNWRLIIHGKLVNDWCLNQLAISVVHSNSQILHSHFCQSIEWLFLKYHVLIITVDFWCEFLHS